MMDNENPSHNLSLTKLKTPPLSQRNLNLQVAEIWKIYQGGVIIYRYGSSTLTGVTAIGLNSGINRPLV